MLFVMYCEICGDVMVVPDHPGTSTGDCTIEGPRTCVEHPGHEGEIKATERLIPTPPFPRPHK